MTRSSGARSRPGEVWQADIAHVATRGGWLYVAGIRDACSRRIVGWEADDAMRYIEIFYNRTRLHGALGFQSPMDFENNLN